MYKFLAGLILFFVTGAQLAAQIFPREGKELNYRIIGFSFPKGQPGCKYKIEIAAGNYYFEDSFKKNIVTSLSSDTNKIIGEVPAFGKPYSWRIIYTENNVTTKSDLHYFSTGKIPEVDTNFNRLRIIKDAEKYSDAYIFLDATGTLYDMRGNPVWFYPKAEEVTTGGSSMRAIRDLKLSPKGTITYLNDFLAKEINYNGDILWNGPNNGVVSGDKTENYHHEFTRMTNGHYMVLGSERWPSENNTKQTSNSGGQQMSLGTIIEYNENGEVVWYWKSSEYFKNSDIYNSKKVINVMYPINDVHENSFFFDEQNKTIYVSFRNISRLLKIKYPEGNVLNTYGAMYREGVPEEENELFCNQHSCGYSEQGYLYLFNNNACRPETMPTIIVMQEKQTEKYGLKKIWEYKCTIEKQDIKAGEFKFNKGGNVIELPDHSFFASMCDMYSKVFIVNKDKEIVWSAMPETWDEAKKKWVIIPLYKANIIKNKTDLEFLVWNAEAK